MTDPAHSALVLQGGGALGAYELGAARALYQDEAFRPDMIAGVSIGAITAVLLARPRSGLTPLEALEQFWKKVTVQAELFPPPLKPYASFFGNAHFFVPRTDYFNLQRWTYFYDTAPLRATLTQLVDLGALADKSAAPGLLVSATDVGEGQIKYFYSREKALTLDHIVASGSLPPAFPPTVIDGATYWDGGLFDNTPLGAVLDKLGAVGPEATVYVVNLFPNKAPLPQNLMQVEARIKNLQFANKTTEDLRLLRRFNEVAALMMALDDALAGNPLAQHPAYAAVKAHGYVHIPHIVSITDTGPFDQFGDADFSPEAIDRRATKGFDQTMSALGKAPRKTPGKPVGKAPGKTFGKTPGTS